MEFGTAFLTVLVVWVAALVTPGPDFAAVVQSAAGGSRRSGLAVAGGVTVSIAAWATASLFGLHAMLLAFAGLSTVLHLAGAVYLSFLGLRLLRAAWQGAASHVATTAPRSAGAAFRYGLLTNLANPKALAIFGSLFALLVPQDAPNWFSAGLLLAVIGTTASWYVLVAVTASTKTIAASYRRAERAIAAVTGALFVGVGVRLASDR